MEASHTIEIDSFVPLGEIDARYFDSPYYIVPNDKVGPDAFAVIREAMRGRKMVGIGRVVISKRERPIILEPMGKGLRGMTLRYPYEVRDEKEYFGDIPDVKVAGDMRSSPSISSRPRQASSSRPRLSITTRRPSSTCSRASRRAGRWRKARRGAAVQRHQSDGRPEAQHLVREGAAAKAQKTKAKKADDLRKQPQFKFPIEGGQAKQGKAKPAKPAAKAGGQARSAAKPKRKSA